MTTQEIAAVVEQHKLWHNHHGGSRAHLRYADLRGADLSGAYLPAANLCSADLRETCLQHAYLQYADLSDANLSRACLMCADMRSADLLRADMRSADLRSADLLCADMRSADLRYATLWGADLRYADLRGAILNWYSHDLIAAILLSEAGTHLARRSLAGLVLVSRDWCWKAFMALTHPETAWAIEVLTPYLRDGETPPWGITKEGTP
jgi:uncharacterized protein YjbI with pentapeptide repeats